MMALRPCREILFSKDSHWILFVLRRLEFGIFL